MADFPTPLAAANADHAAALLALRQRAEQRRHLVTQPTERQSADELQRLVQELQTHQIELEMQYEELLLAQAEAQRARAQYVDLYDFAPVGYVTLAADGTIAQLNLRASRLLGTSRQRLEGRRFALFVAPADRAAFHTFLAQALAAEHSLSCELGLLRDDGTPFFAQLEALRADEPIAGSYPPPVGQVRLALLDITARRAATEELAASAARFRTLFEQSPDGMLLIEDGRMVEANAVALRLFGLPSKSQLLGQAVGSFAPPAQPDGRESAGAMREHLATAQRQGWNRFEWYRLDAAGHDQWLEVTAAPVVVGPQSLMQVAVRDITAPRAAQRELRTSEERQQLALAATESGVFRLDLQTRLLFGDARIWALLERPGPPELLSPLPFDEFGARLPAADQALLTTAIEQALTSARPVEVELRFQLPDGGLRYLQIMGRRDPADQDEPAFVLTGLARDVTARRLAEEELGYKNRLLAHIIDNLPVTMGQLTPDGRYVELLGQGLRRLGMQDNELQGRSIFEVFPTLAEPTRRLLAGEQVNFVGSSEVNGQRVHMQSYGFFDQQQQRAVVFAIDVTDMVEAREEAAALRLRQQQQVLAATLEAQETERRRIAESVHNSLGQLLYATKLALSGPPSPASSQRAAELLDEAIRATRTISFELTPGVLNDFGLAAALQELTKRLPGERLPLRMHLHGLGPQRLPPAVEIAAYRIAQELINNVIKHAQARAAALYVTLADEPDRRLRLLMQDDGRGFDPAAQACATDGGIGLRGIRHRVELLGGQLQLDSQPGCGAAITVELPL